MNRIHDGLFGCLLLLTFSYPVRVPAQEAQAQAEITQKGDGWVGQSIPLVIELLVPGYFAGTPSFDLPRVPDMLLMPLSERPVLGSERIQNTSYTTQRHEFLILVRRAGDYQIPAFTVRLKYKRNPLDQEAVSQIVSTEPVQFSAKAPPGAEDLAGLLSTNELKVVEKWQPQPGHAKTGDAFTRTVTFSAADIPAMALPPFQTRPIEGLGIYLKDPEVLDHSERGVLRGERRDTITYVCQRAGRFIIPSAQLTWWNLNTKELRTITFPAQVLEVAANPALRQVVSAETRANGSSPISTQSVVGLTLVVIAAGAALWITRALWSQVVVPFCPRHLAPLNPTDDQLKNFSNRSDLKP
jgi:hypothetical protein